MSTAIGRTLQIGMNDRLFASNLRPILDDIAFAQANGFEVIQFHGTLAGVGEAEIGQPPDLVGAALEHYGVGAVMEIVLRVDDQARTLSGQTPLEVLHANLPVIRALRCSRVHWHPIHAMPLEAHGRRELEQRLLPYLAQAVELARDEGFVFGVEHNEPKTDLFSTPEVCAATLAEVAGLGFVWDLNHTPPEWLDAFLALTPRMSLLHVADTPLPEVNHHLPLGRGTIDFAAYFRALLAGGFRGPAILEIGGLPRSGGYGQDTDAALRDSRARLLAALE